MICTLASYFRVPKDQIIEKVSIIIGSDAVHIPDKDPIAEALLLYGRKNIDYSAANNTALMKSLGLPEIFSYDRDFDKVEGIKRLEP